MSVVKKAIRNYILKRDRFLCKSCLMKLKDDSFATIDHIIPKQYGGSSDLSNLQLMCRRCNQVKGMQTEYRIYGKSKLDF